jgi:Na+-driven multidrug efflux pump
VAKSSKAIPCLNDSDEWCQTVGGSMTGNCRKTIINGCFLGRRGPKTSKKLLIKQAVPASIGILFLSVNILIDTIFVGQWIGSRHCSSYCCTAHYLSLISSLGMAIGVGGGSVLSRALGARIMKNKSTFANQIK